MKCAKGYEIKPMQSPAGWYLGTCDNEGFPNCRLTTCYAKSKEAAKNLAMDRQMAAENEFCNSGCGCIVNFQVNPKFVEAMHGLTHGYKTRGDDFNGRI